MKRKIKNAFFWCHVRYINLSKKQPERIKKMIKRVVQKLNFDVIKFPVQEKGFHKIEVKNNKRINVFGYEHGLVFSIYF